MSDKLNSEALKIGGQISILQKFHRRFITAFLSDSGLSGTMHMILTTLTEHPGVSQDYLSARFNMDKGIIARQCKALEEADLIRREVNENDRRQYCLYLTEQGKQQVPVIMEGYQKWSNLICNGFSEEETDLACRLLARMVDNCRNDLGDL